jgi:hypothetical protein
MEVAGMPDDHEILLAEIAILRQEIAHLQAQLEQTTEALHSLNIGLLQKLDVLSEMLLAIQSRLGPLPQ